MAYRKIRKTVILSALALLTAFSFSACSQNSTTSSSSKSSIASVEEKSSDPAIIGTWKNEDPSERYFFTYTFNADNTGTKASVPNYQHSAYWEGFTSSKDQFTYKFRGNSIHIDYKDGGYNDFDYIASGDTLKLSERYKNQYKNYQRTTAQ
jgi:ABC-type oligopeptide transport system substrate-binding subunit